MKVLDLCSRQVLLLALGIFVASNPVVLAQTTDSSIEGETIAPSPLVLTNPRLIVPQGIIVPPANTVVKAKPLTISFRDGGTQVNDGDAITVTLNGKIIVNDLLLTSVDQAFQFTLDPGQNTLTVVATSEGVVPNSTPLVTITQSQIYSGTPQYGYVLTVGQSASFSLAFVQVGVAQVSTSPMAAQHALDAQTAGRSRLCTKDQAGTQARRTSSLALSGLPPISTMQRDEYPPAICLENAGAADVKYIENRDNSVAGGFLGGGIKPFANGDTVELVVVP
jgi:hypothetical protein